MKKALITGFKPFGFLGRITKTNPSNEIALYLSIEFKTDLLILPVDKNCIEQLRKKIKDNSYSFIFMLGHGGTQRIETKTFKGTKSIFAEKIKNQHGLLKKENIGNFYCNQVYEEALKHNKKTVFVHVPFMYNYESIRNIFKLAMKTK